MQEYDVGSSCSEHRRHEKCAHWEDVWVYFDEIGYECVHCIRLAQDRDWGRAVVNTVMNLWVVVIFIEGTYSI
jgi:hypothetical protein